MKKYCVIGEKLTHTLSPDIHQKFFNKMNYDAIYDVNEIPLDKIDKKETKDLLLSYDGINVTIPYKEKVMVHLDGISDFAKEIGAVNTIENINGKLYGHNTDPYGFEGLLKYNGIEVLGKNCVVLGTGGAAKSIVTYLKTVTDKILVVSRHEEGLFLGAKIINYNDLKNIKADILINATPSGMYPNVNNCPVGDSVIGNFSALVDIIYNPIQTQFLKKGADLNKRVVSGFYMLVAQAMKSQSIWNHIEVKKDVIDDIFKSLEWIRRKDLNSNIYLTGMMGSGKSTLGKYLAEKIGYNFIDIDDYVQKKYNSTIDKMFEIGQEYFRDCETKALIDISKMNKTIVATGGGIVLKKSNVDIMKLTGTIIFRDRDVDSILKTIEYSTRPLLKNGEGAFRDLFEKRYDIYVESADFIIKSEDVEKDANTIIRWLK